MSERGNIAALPQLRGTARLHTCEHCGGLHGACGTLAGFPLLRCAAVSPKDVMLLKGRQIIVGDADEPAPRRKA